MILVLMNWLQSDDRWLIFGSTSVSSGDTCKQNGLSTTANKRLTMKNLEIGAPKKHFFLK